MDHCNDEILGCQDTKIATDISCLIRRLSGIDSQYVFSGYSQRNRRTRRRIPKRLDLLNEPNKATSR